MLGIPMVLPSGPGPPRHGTSADEVLRESLRDLFALELALGQLGGDASRVLNNVQQACSGCAGVAEARLTFAAGSAVAELLERAVNELYTLRRSLQRSRARWNLPPALAFEESSLRQPVNRGPVPPALQSHPDVVMPRCLRYHTPVQHGGITARQSATTRPPLAAHLMARQGRVGKARVVTPLGGGALAQPPPEVRRRERALTVRSAQAWARRAVRHAPPPNGHRRRGAPSRCVRLSMQLCALRTAPRVLGGARGGARTDALGTVGAASNWPHV